MSSVFQSTAAAPFRGPSAARSYATRVRWLVGTLGSIIALLVTALFLLLQSSATTPQDGGELPPAEPAHAAPGKLSILIARQRIEAGTPLGEALFDSQEINPGYMPDGAIPVSERSSILGQYAKELINAGFPLTRPALSSTPLSSDDLFIPPGFRAIAISIDEVRSVAYNITPGSRVDVNLSFTYKGQPAVVPVVETAKVLNIGVGPNTGSNRAGAQTATLLVSADDARKIELSRKLGELSLVLAGNTEPPAAFTNTKPKTPPDIFDSGEEQPKAEPHYSGKMRQTDPKTGEQISYVLINGQWTRER